MLPRGNTNPNTWSFPTTSSEFSQGLLVHPTPIPAQNQLPKFTRCNFTPRAQDTPAFLEDAALDLLSISTHYHPFQSLSSNVPQLMILTVFFYPKPELSRSTWDCSTRVQILHPISNPLGQALECAKWKDSMTESWKICPCDPLSLYPAPLAHEGIHFKKEKKNKNQAVGQFQDLLR